jgi:hypothetical protein
MAKEGGAKFVDKRNWKSCNKELIIRGEFSLPIYMFDNWYEELDKMNEGKKCGRMNFLNNSLKSRLYGISGLITCFLRW